MLQLVSACACSAQHYAGKWWRNSNWGILALAKLGSSSHLDSLHNLISWRNRQVQLGHRADKAQRQIDDLLSDCLHRRSNSFCRLIQRLWVEVFNRRLEVHKYKTHRRFSFKSKDREPWQFFWGKLQDLVELLVKGVQGQPWRLWLRQSARILQLHWLDHIFPYLWLSHHPDAQSVDLSYHASSGWLHSSQSADHLQGKGWVDQAQRLLFPVANVRIRKWSQWDTICSLLGHWLFLWWNSWHRRAQRHNWLLSWKAWKARRIGSTSYWTCQGFARVWLYKPRRPSAKLGLTWLAKLTSRTLQEWT